MALIRRARVSALTRASGALLSTRETAEIDTPARRATGARFDLLGSLLLFTLLGGLAALLSQSKRGFDAVQHSVEIMPLHGFGIAIFQIDVKIILRLAGVDDVETFGIPERLLFFHCCAQFLDML